MSKLVKRYIGCRDNFLVGELNCRRCGVVDIQIGGVEMNISTKAILSKCPKCGAEEWVCWANKIRDWDSRMCLFVWGDVVV